jgi:hypothetical protein
VLITFSGLDGAGKSSLIAWLSDELRRRRLAVAVLRLNDDVSVYALVRRLRDRVRGGRPPEGPPRMEPLPTPLGRLRDLVLWSKVLRRLIYPVDVLCFLGWRLYHETLRRRVLIMDRYLYDTLVDVAGPRGWTWLRLLAWLTPTPDLPVLLDISAEEAYARKREYTVPYLADRAAAYRRVFPWVSRHVRLPAHQLDDAKRALALVVRERVVA